MCGWVMSLWVILVMGGILFVFLVVGWIGNVIGLCVMVVWGVISLGIIFVVIIVVIMYNDCIWVVFDFFKWVLWL